MTWIMDTNPAPGYHGEMLMEKTRDSSPLIRYSRRGPRYTSYPPATMFHGGLEGDEYARFLADETRADVPLSLYFHIPFCSSICWFCACNVVYTANRGRSGLYLDLIEREMDLLARHIAPERETASLHLGGGSPTFLSPDELMRLHAAAASRFTFMSGAEKSIELDPRTTSEEHVEVLARLGFTRASLGVQDMDPLVQKAIHRMQPPEMTEKLTWRLREHGFHGVNFDLIYGLPHQTTKSFQRTLDSVADLRPDRLSLFQFAYMPRLKKHQERIAANALPDARTRVEIFSMAVERLLAEGYLHIGMDHFALPEDPLATALENGTLNRNFQGYVADGDFDLLGIGPSSIGEVSGAFAQNFKSMNLYEQALKSGRLPIERGYIRTEDDWIRARVIKDLICRFELDIAALEGELEIRFADYFHDELPALTPFAEDGLLEINEDRIRVTDRGKFVIRNICMVFDAHLDADDAGRERYSRTV